MAKSRQKRPGKVWHKVTMSVDKDNADTVRRALQTAHCCGIQTEDEEATRERLDAYFDNAIDASELQRHVEIIAELISAAGGRRLRLGQVEAVPEDDWLEEWRRHWKPVRVTKSLIICPSWEKFPASAGQTVIYIYPKMAFGTGSHPTTQLCLRLLERFMPPGASVIDIGAGTGILAIGAAKLGARRVTAVEMDDAAVENAEENCTINRVRSRVRIVHGRFDRRIRGKFDLGVCNMLSQHMTPLVDDMTRLLRGKRFIASGLTSESVGEIRQALKQRGWRIHKTVAGGEWRGLYASHELS